MYLRPHTGSDCFVFVIYEFGHSYTLYIQFDFREFILIVNSDFLYNHGVGINMVFSSYLLMV